MSLMVSDSADELKFKPTSLSNFLMYSVKSRPAKLFLSIACGKA
jgi:hypothetical protein